MRRACFLPYLSLGVSDNRRGILGSRDVSVTILITSMSGSKSLTFFAYRIFYFRKPPGLRLVFDAAERNGKFDRIYCQRTEESCSRGTRKRGVFHCRRTVTVKVKGKVFPTSFLKIVGKGQFIGAEERRKGNS